MIQQHDLFNISSILMMHSEMLIDLLQVDEKGRENDDKNNKEYNKTISMLKAKRFFFHLPTSVSLGSLLSMISKMQRSHLSLRVPYSAPTDTGS